MKSSADSWTINVSQDPRQRIDHQCCWLGVCRSQQTGNFFHTELVNCERSVIVPAKWVHVSIVKV